MQNSIFLLLPVMKIVTIIGARPQIIKAAALSRAIAHFSHSIEEIIVHTGQHYDPGMSDVFFTELGIPKPNYNLNVGSGSHGAQTAAMISGIESILQTEKPNWLVLYGDTNSTLAGAVAASKIHIPIAHIEAGLRSFNKAMPEEVNRIMCDHVSTLLFAPTAAGYRNLLNEGFKAHQGPYTANKPGIFHCGDLMYDNSMHFAEVAAQNNAYIETNRLNAPFILATIHRNANTDNAERLLSLLNTLNEISLKDKIRVILPVHPRTRKMIDALDPLMMEALRRNELFVFTEPASFLEMIALEQHAKLVITDSGGVQKEAYYFKKPCIILRPETEWIELVEQDCARICDADPEKIAEAYRHFSSVELDFPPLFGDGNAADFMLQQLWDNQTR
jgi:UDP-GlcNAc3NAcA epimerase